MEKLGKVVSGWRKKGEGDRGDTCTKTGVRLENGVFLLRRCDVRFVRF